MSTNAPTANTRNAPNGKSSSVKGMKTLPAEDTPDIQPGEMGYPLQGQPWSMFGQQDPDVMEFYREVKLEDLHRMTQRDGHAKALLNVLTWPCQAAKRRIDPTDGGEEEADHIRNMLDKPPREGGMSTTMSYVIETTCLAFRDGFSVHEKVVEEKDGLLVLRKLAPRPARTLVFKYDDHGGLAGVKQKVWWKGELKEIDIPPEKLMLYTVGKAEQPLEGESLFLPAYYHYDKKHRLYYIAHIAAQVGAVPLRVGKLASTSSKARQMFQRALQQLGLQGAVVVPAGAEVETHQNLSILGDIIKLIEHHDMAMSKSILAHFLDVGTEGKGNMGTATTTSELGDLFLVALESRLQDIADGFNAYLIPYFIDKNFGSGKYPTFVFEPFNDDQKAMIGEVFGKLYAPAVQPMPEMMFELQRRMADELGLEGIDWDELQAQFEAEQEAKRELAETARKAQLDQLKNPPPPTAPGAGSNGAPPGAPGGAGRPAPPAPSPIPPIKLDDPTDPLAAAREATRRAIELAERSLGAREVVTDAIGERIGIGDQVMLAAGAAPGGDETVYTITAILGQVVQMRTPEGAVRTALPNQLIRLTPTPTPAAA